MPPASGRATRATLVLACCAAAARGARRAAALGRCWLGGALLASGVRGAPARAVPTRELDGVGVEGGLHAVKF